MPTHKTNQIGYVVPDHGAYPYFEEFRKTGKKVIVIDPTRTETVKFFDAEWIAIRPNTDVAMMLGIAHALYSEGLHDQDFLDEYTVGFDKFLPYLTGESDGVAKTPEWASQIARLASELNGLSKTGTRQAVAACFGALEVESALVLPALEQIWAGIEKEQIHEVHPV